MLEAEDSAEKARAIVRLQKRVFATRLGRLLLARELVKGTGRRSGVKAKDVRFAPIRSLRAGDGGFVLRFTVAARGQTVVITQGYMSVGPIETIVTLGGRKHSRLPSRLVSLMRTRRPTRPDVYALGITAVDSILYDLPFERFLSSTRDEEPDIDVDFDSDRREEVIQ